MKYFKQTDIRRFDLERLEAEALNRLMPGRTYNPVVKHHVEMVALSDACVGPALKGRTLHAKGSIEKPKGGMIRGGLIWR